MTRSRHCLRLGRSRWAESDFGQQIKVFVWGMCVWVCLVDLRWSGINDLVTKLMLHFLVRRSWLWPDLVTALDSVGADGLRATSGSKYWPKQILLMSCFKIECQNSTIDLHFSSWHCLNPFLLSPKSRRQRQDPGQTRHAGMQISPTQRRMIVPLST